MMSTIGLASRVWRCAGAHIFLPASTRPRQQTRFDSSLLRELRDADGRVHKPTSRDTEAAERLILRQCRRRSELLHRSSRRFCRIPSQQANPSSISGGLLTSKPTFSFRHTLLC